MAFKKATLSGVLLRLGFEGSSGSGKTYTALAVGSELAKKYGSRLALIDTERGSASKYSDLFDFDVLELDTFEAEKYIGALSEAEKSGYRVVIIDSLSHAWAGVGGMLERADNAAKKSRSGNTYMAWREVTPVHNRLVDAMLQFNGHLIVTMRTKTEYVIETINGKSVPRKVGMAPIQRDGMEYEFDIMCDVDLDHNVMVSKTRCQFLDGKVFHKPGKDFADIITGWIDGSGGMPLEPPKKTEPVKPAPEKPKEPVATQAQIDELVRLSHKKVVTDESILSGLANLMGESEPSAKRVVAAIGYLNGIPDRESE